MIVCLSLRWGAEIRHAHTRVFTNRGEPRSAIHRLMVRVTLECSRTIMP